MKTMTRQAAPPARDSAAPVGEHPPLPPVFGDRAEQDHETEERIRVARQRLGSRLVILGHHYQRDEVIRHADFRGDSFDLSRRAAETRDARFIVFCGVHFMAETADILTADDQAVILPDLNAGCSMADMATIDQVEECWDALGEVIEVDRVVPITYMNSSAAIKAFCGRHGGTVCTSSNAEAILRWAFERGDRILFLPDQHLGRNTGHAMGIPLEAMPLWDPAKFDGGVGDDALRAARIILWKGHCSVHQNFLPQHVDLFRERWPGINILVHPECQFDVVQKADYVGSTAFIIETIRHAPAGSRWAIGTEHHLVQRLHDENPHLEVGTLSPFACQCSTMFRIDPGDLAGVLEALAEGREVNRIVVPPEDKAPAREALQRMLDITAASKTARAGAGVGD
jgi:quinolinate synthase